MRRPVVVTQEKSGLKQRQATQSGQPVLCYGRAGTWFWIALSYAGYFVGMMSSCQRLVHFLIVDVVGSRSRMKLSIPEQITFYLVCGAHEPITE